MATVYDVMGALETLYPLRYAEDWDHPGLIVGDLRNTVNNIVFAADPTMEVVEDAIASGADMLVTHHPLFFRAVHEVSGRTFRGRIVNLLAKHDCALWVGHTNADAAYRGVAQAAADAFGLEDQVPIVPIDDPTSSHAVGIGRFGRLGTPTTLERFASLVAQVLPFTKYGIQVAGPLDMPIRTVAVLPGSGDSMFANVHALHADVYVTSDLRHHPATDELQESYYEAAMRREGIGLGGASDCPHMRPALINTPHSAIESMWFNYALEDVPRRVQEVTGDIIDVRWNTTSTDPWDLVLPGVCGHSGPSPEAGR